MKESRSAVFFALILLFSAQALSAQNDSVKPK
jgi:hypothetical protein